MQLTEIFIGYVNVVDELWEAVDESLGEEHVVGGAAEEADVQHRLPHAPALPQVPARLLHRLIRLL